VLAWVVVMACKKAERDDALPAPAPAPPVDVLADARLPAPDALAFTGDVAAICETTKRLIERAIRCVPSSADRLRDTLRDLEPDVPSETLPAEHERRAAMCAGIARSYDEQLAALDPACALTSDERTRNDAFLAAYHGRRTKPRPTGDAHIDENLAELAAARDVLCACSDEECVRASHAIVTDAVKPVPRELEAAMQDGEAILDEVSRCAQRIEVEAARARR